ncbi:MAG: hypothetical protein ACRETD_10375, partial [Steroidobacteraceae bacterium]
FMPGQITAALRLRCALLRQAGGSKQQANSNAAPKKRATRWRGNASRQISLLTHEKAPPDQTVQWTAASE